MISIPYGAIKRRSKVVIYKVNSDISIPYGAIKRSTNSIKISINFTFQFLMVRLKEDLKIMNSFLDSYFNSLWCD